MTINDSKDTVIVRSQDNLLNLQQVRICQNICLIMQCFKIAKLWKVDGDDGPHLFRALSIRDNALLVILSG